jgi:trehalose-phosphatase
VLELKPTGFAFHYRNADQAAADAAVAELLATVQELNELHIRHGKKVIELSVVNMNKGQALLRLRRTLEATAVIFLGDDLTDEDVFTMLGPGDLGIKVGEGPTAAAHRVADTGAVGRLLARASALRRAWTAREGLARPESRI